MAKRLAASNGCDFSQPPEGAWRPFRLSVRGEVNMLNFRLMGHAQALLAGTAPAAAAGALAAAVEGAVAAAAAAVEAVDRVSVTINRAITCAGPQQCVVAVAGRVRLEAPEDVHMACFYDDAISEVRRALFRAA